MRHIPLAGAALAALAGGAVAADDLGIPIELALNEIYASHTGTDDQEYVEVRATAGIALTDVVVLVVEGEGGGKGTLDRVWDLSAVVVPDDGGGFGFIVIGGAAVANLDVNVGTTNVIENGTETFYLVTTSDVAALSALVGTDVDANDDCSILDDLGALVVTVHDVVAMIDGDFTATDLVYDGAAPIGPDGTFFPAGIFRIGDAPGPWCTTTFLDFDDVANANQPRTPGASNTAVCAAGPPGFAFCFGNGCPCANDDPSAGCANSTGFGGVLVGSGTTSVSADDLVLDASFLPRRQNGLFYMGNKAATPVLFFDGLGCLSGTTFRFLASIQSSGETGTMTHTGFVGQAGLLIAPGLSWFFQCWYRDYPATPCGTQANLTNAWGVTFTP